MRKISLVSSTFALALLISGSVMVANASAFPLFTKKADKTVKTTDTRKQPVAAANTAGTDAQKPEAPASKEEREKAKSADLVAQATFWMGELGKNEKDEEAAVYASNALIGIGSYQRALEVAVIGIQANENNAQLWKNTGKSLLGLKRNQEAIQALTKAAALLPNDIEVRNAIGVAYDDLGQSTMAIKSFNDALAINPNNAVTLTNLGLAQALNGDLKTAEITLRKAQSIPYAPIQARQNLALIVALQGRFKESEQIASQDLPDELAKQNVAYVQRMLDGGNARTNVSQQ